MIRIVLGWHIAVLVPWCIALAVVSCGDGTMTFQACAAACASNGGRMRSYGTPSDPLMSNSYATCICQYETADGGAK